MISTSVSVGVMTILTDASDRATDSDSLNTAASIVCNPSVSFSASKAIRSKVSASVTADAYGNSSRQ